MRTAFVNTLTEIARKDKDIFLLTGDLGYSVFENFMREFPARCYNIGVAEANMAGIAAGLALSGKKVFIYSIVPFVTMRCFEQVRNDICYQNLNVRIVGVGGGLCYGTAGMTHHSIEDIAIMRSLPNMTVICPGDPQEAGLAVKSSLSYQGPIYIRLGKGKEPNVHTGLKDFVIGKAITLRQGNDIALIAAGNMLQAAREVAERLTAKNISVRLISMHTIKPLDADIIKQASCQAKAIFTIEEHSLTGGLGSAVAEVLAETGNRAYFRRIALRDACIKEVGSQEYLREKQGLDVQALERNILAQYSGI
jgi:transketolase